MRMRQAERQAERQRAAVEGITNAGTEEGGGVVWYDCDDDSQGIVITGKTPGPAWLRRILGDDFFRHPIGAIVTTDEGLVYAKRLPELQKLQAYGYKWEGDEGHMVLAIKTKVTNTGLQHLVEFDSLSLPEPRLRQDHRRWTWTSQTHDTTSRFEPHRHRRYGARCTGITAGSAELQD